MIKYNLDCKSCNKSFDSWFASSSEYDKIKKLNLLQCKFCSNTTVSKSIMAPNLKNLKNQTKDKINFSKIRNKIKNYQQFIKKNFDYVGKNFTYEARTLHYSKTVSKKGIYGIADKNEIEELKEEGIETHTVPWINEKEN